MAELRNLGLDTARLARSVVRKTLHRGDAHVCILCGESCGRWLDDREFGRCPSCTGATRSRVMWTLLETMLRPSRHVLHFAPQGRVERLLRARPVAYTTVDLNRSDVDVQANILSLPFDDASFDLVICSHVLEHIDDDATAMSELRRVTRKDGATLIQVPLRLDRPTDEDPEVTDPQARKERFGELDHVRWYGLDIEGRLEAAGFAVERWHALEEIAAEDRHRLGLDPDQVVFVCRPAR